MVLDMHIHNHNYDLKTDSSFPQQSVQSTKIPQTSGPQNNSWLFRGKTAPSFTPPAPAETAAAWANHASMANDKAQDALRDIMQIRTDAANRVNVLNLQAQQTMDQVEALRASTLHSIKTDSAAVYNNYFAAKAAVSKMLHAAQKQALAAKELATGTQDAIREQQLSHKMTSSSLKSSSFADDSNAGEKPHSDAPKSSEPVEKAEPSSRKIDQTKTDGSSSSLFPGGDVGSGKLTEPQQTSDQRDLDNILKMIRRFSSNKVEATKTVAGIQEKDDLTEISQQASADSRHKSSEELKQSWENKNAKAQSQIKFSKDNADVKAFMARLSEGTLLYDTAAAVSAALKSAKDLGDALVMKELDAEKQILGLLNKAQQSTIDAANEASRAEMIAFKAAKFTQKMASSAAYAQNAAGQAMAAQMAQAMGFQVAPRPVNVPPPTLAGIDQLAILFVAEKRRSTLSSLI